MKSDAVLVAQANANAELYRQIGNVLTNPLLSFVIGYLAIEYAQSHEETVTLVDYNQNPPKYWTEKRRIAGGGWVDSVTATSAEIALGTATLTPSAVKISEQIKPLFETIAKLAPVITKV